MGWSISPTAGATINDSGVATFTANGTFTITYTDSNGCTGSTTYTVSGCGGGKTNVNISLGCSLNSSNTTLTVTATADRTVDTTVTVSTTISATLNTSGGGTTTSSQGLDITIDSGHSSGSNTIDANEFWDGVSYVSASSSIDSFSPSSSSSQDYIKGSGCSASGGGGTCDCSGVDMTRSITATSEEGSEGAEGNYPRDCTSRMSYTAPEWVTIRFENGGIMVDHKKNTTSSERSGTIEIKMDGTVCKTATITQRAGGGETDTISFRGHNCNAEYGTIEVVSITLSDGSTVSCGVAEAVNAGGEEHLGTVDVTGKTGKSITGGTVKFNGSTTSDFTGLSGTISDGAEFTVTVGNCGGGCQYPGESIQIWLTGLTNSYEHYVLTDEVIGANCQNWVMSSGYKYSPSDYGLSLGYYQYNNCSLTDYDSGESYYCDIATPGASDCNGYNRKLSASTSYHLYGFNGSGYTEIRTVWMPDGSTAQSGADSQKQYKV